MAATTDYDAPRTRPGDEPETTSLDELRAGRASSASAVALLEDGDPSEADLDVPGADLSGEELTLLVLPQQSDEFTCTSCWLVHHRSQRVGRGDTCVDCAA